MESVRIPHGVVEYTIYDYGGFSLLEYTRYRSRSPIMFVQCGVQKSRKMRTRLGSWADSSVATQQCTIH